MIRIYPYKVGSKSVKKLNDALGGLIIKTAGSRYRYRIGHTVINWGNSQVPDWYTDDVKILNKPQAVALTVDKLKTFQELSGRVPTVEWTDDIDKAEEWLAEGEKVFVRHKLNGHSGDGIQLFDGHISDVFRTVTEFLNELEMYDVVQQLLDTEGNLSLPPAPLYTKGVVNDGEYRVHVFNGEVILYQKKSRRVDEDGNVIEPDGEEDDVRNLASNWVYRTQHLHRLTRIEELAVRAIEALGLDFGAVDIIMDEDGNVFVLEVNSAPGISNTETGEAYIRAFNSLV